MITTTIPRLYEAPPVEQFPMLEFLSVPELSVYARVNKYCSRVVRAFRNTSYKEIFDRPVMITPRDVAYRAYSIDKKTLSLKAFIRLHIQFSHPFTQYILEAGKSEVRRYNIFLPHPSPRYILEAVEIYQNNNHSEASTSARMFLFNSFTINKFPWCHFDTYPLTSVLCLSASKNDLDMANAFIKSSWFSLTRSQDVITAFHTATIRGYIEISNALIQSSRFSEIPIEGEMGLISCLEHRDTRISAAIVSAIARHPDGISCLARTLRYAASRGNLKAVHAIIHSPSFAEMSFSQLRTAWESSARYGRVQNAFKNSSRSIEIQQLLEEEESSVNAFLLEAVKEANKICAVKTHRNCTIS